MRILIFCLVLLTATPALADSQGGGLGTRVDAQGVIAPSPLKSDAPGPAVINESGTEAVIGQAARLNAGDQANLLRQLQQQLLALRQTEQALRQKLAQLQAKLAAEEDADKRRALQAQIDATEAQLRHVREQREQLEARMREIASPPAPSAPEIKARPQIRTKHKLKGTE